ncbi:MAG: ABC transporter ATP-binding protein [Quadrisphaera sp.]
MRQWSAADEVAVADAMVATGVDELRDRLVEELSGGQRQRVWVAVALAQQTPLLLLDEPTTFLDIAHQVELLDLFADLHEAGTTVVAVLHDLGHAARYATHLVVVDAGDVVAAGPPAEVLTAELVERVYGLACVVVPDPVTGTPLVVPRGREERRSR